MDTASWEPGDGAMTFPDGTQLLVTPAEARLVDLLWASRPRFTTAREIARQLFLDVDIVKVYVARIRRKGIPIENRHGFGYRLGAHRE